MTDIQSKIKKDINKKYGNVMVTADEIVNKDRKIISVSPVIDYYAGGIPEGSLGILSGVPKTGKSVTALQIAANAQQQYNKPIYIGNVEHRLNKKELSGIHNLDTSKIEMIQSIQGKILSSEDFLQEFIEIIKSVPECVLIIDSTSALCAEGEFTEEMRATGRNVGPKLLAKFCRKVGDTISVQNSVIITIQHLIANTSGYGEPYFEDGGRKIQHRADWKLRSTSFQKWENSDKKQIGQVTSWLTKTSALKSPGTKFKSYIRYGYGIDDIKEYINMGLDMGVIEKGGAWCSFCGYKVQGEDNLRQKLLEDTESLNKLKNEIDSML